jgi:tetratricopeptide (TPR) repeat protein
MKQGTKTILVLLFGVFLAGVLWGVPQSRSSDDKNKSRRRPVLIRDDQTRAPQEIQEEEFELDPAKAREYFEVGEFYLKRKRYDAALMRFRDAIKYDPKFHEAKWMFIYTLEQREDWENLVSFARAYLEADDMPEYGKKIREALQKAEKELQKLQSKKKE